jgi:hypothetical protein
MLAPPATQSSANQSGFLQDKRVAPGIALRFVREATGFVKVPFAPKAIVEDFPPANR